MEGASDGSGKKTAGFEETRLKKWQGGHFLRTFQGSGGPYPLHCLAATKAPPIPRRLFHMSTKRNIIPNSIRDLWNMAFGLLQTLK